MTSPTLEIQKAIYDRLLAAPAVTALIGQRVHDDVPDAPVFPYVSFGPSDELTDDVECIDGFDITMQLDVWSRAVGVVETREIADAVRQALHGFDLTLPNNALVSFQHRITRTFRDPDGLTSHAALTFEAFAEKP